jgi:hypothetical protein
LPTTLPPLASGVLRRVALPYDRLNFLPQVIRHFLEGVQVLASLHNSRHLLEYRGRINPNLVGGQHPISIDPIIKVCEKSSSWYYSNTQGELSTFWDAFSYARYQQSTGIATLLTGNKGDIHRGYKFFNIGRRE